jgi:hypothetical protein
VQDNQRLAGASKSGRILQLTTTTRDEDSSELSWVGEDIWTEPDMFVAVWGARMREIGWTGLW